VNAKQAAAKNGTQSPATYVNPPDFRDRNKRLFDNIERVMRTASRRTVHSPDPSANPMADFKTASVSYRNGKMTAEEYYATVQRLVGGAQQLRVFFAELVALLPDVTAQNKLVEVHRQRADMDGVGPLKTANKPSAWNVQVCACVHMCRHALQTNLYTGCTRVCDVLLVCNKCGQVLSENDYNWHIAIHTQNSMFPVLGS
jgi:hypothetical protein